MPALKQRKDDAVLLAEHFLRIYATQYDVSVRRLSPNAIARIRAYSWPGNIRELENLMLREVLLTDGEVIDLATLATAPDGLGHVDLDLDQAFKPAKAMAVARFEKNYLRHLLEKTCGNVSLAARLSRKDRSALNRLVKKHGLTTEEFRQVHG
jgi:DNA-binding NtrC family response regulator